jgi:hypothetical protein
MKKARVLVLVLAVVLSSQLFSETLDSQQSFELGKSRAREEHKTWGWYFLGVASGLLAQGLVFAILEVDMDSTSSGLVSLGGSVITILPFVPALLFPRRDSIYPYFGNVDLECYRDGYRRMTRWENCGAVLLGELTAYAVIFVGARIYLGFAMLRGI